MMRQRNRLRALQMGIPRHGGVEVAPRDPNQGCAQDPDQFIDVLDFVAQIETQVERDLVVARTRGVELAPGLPDFRDQASLDREVDVFVGGDKAKLPGFDLLLDLAKTALHRAPLGGADQADARQHAGMGDRTKDVVAIETAVERQRSGERFDFGQTPAREPAAD
jgi:hypothetical protein